MADNTPKTEEATPKPVEEKKPEEVKPAETKEAAKPAVTEEKKAAAAEDLPDVSHSEEFKTMEEDETMLLNVRAKLYRFHLETKEWRERGTGQARLLKHKVNNRIRFLMRRDKTFKICGNHYVTPTMELQVNKNNDKSWIWNCPADYSEDPAKPSNDIYAIRFTSADDTAAFKKAWLEAQEHMKTLLEKK